MMSTMSASSSTTKMSTGQLFLPFVTGQGDGERRAPARSAIHAERTAMQGHERAGDWQSQAASCLLLGQAVSRSIELLEDPCLLVGAQARTRVAHGDLHEASVRATTDGSNCHGSRRTGRASERR